MALMENLRTAEPRGAAPVHGPNVEPFLAGDHPDGHQAAERPVSSARRDVEFIGRRDLRKLVVRP
jgi:hypothetical protein